MKNMRFLSVFVVVVLLLILTACAIPPRAQIRESVSSAPIPSDAPPSYVGPKATIFVEPVEGIQNIKVELRVPGLDEQIRTMLATALMATGKFRVVERERIRTILQEQDLTTAGRIRPDTGTKTGELTGADLMIKIRLTGHDVGYNALGVGLALLGVITGVPVTSLVGNVRDSRFVADLQLFETRSGEMIHANVVVGDSTAWGGAVGILSRISLGVGIWKDTPLEESLRLMVATSVQEATKKVEELSRIKPPGYFKH